MKVNNLININTYKPNNNQTAQKNNFVQSYQVPNLANYSPLHARANFGLSFGQGLDDSAVEASQDNAVIVHPYKKNYYFTSDFYDKNADDLAISLLADKNVLLTYPHETAMPELLIEKFLQNFVNDKYDMKGYEGHKSRVFVYDYRTDDIKPQNPSSQQKTESKKIGIEAIKDIADHNKKEKIVLIIPNFIKCMENHKESPIFRTLFSRGKFASNVQVIAVLTNKDKEKIISDEKSNLKFIDKFEELSVEIPNEKETKLMLKTNKDFVGNICKKYKKVKLSVEDSAIDAVVDKSARIIDGEFPGKALKVLDYVISTKLVETDIKDTITPYSVTAKDVDYFFDEKNRIVDTMRVRGKRFSQVEIPKTKFSDIGGNKEAIETLKDVIKDINNPGAKPPKGVLFYGPPGTGKTLLARALAGEAQVPFFSVTGSSFVEKYVGVGAARVRELFSEARVAADKSEKKTAIIFIDEFDSLAVKRTEEGTKTGNNEAENTLNELIAQMDGFENTKKRKIIVIAATNRKNALDPAAIRKGRFDDLIEIKNPSNSVKDRLEIISIYSKNLKFKNDKEKANLIEEAARVSHSLSPAEIEDMMHRCGKIADKRGSSIEPNDLVESYLQVKIGKKTKTEATEGELVLTAAHECGHAVVCKAFNDLMNRPWKKITNISFITNEQRGGMLGAVFYKQDDNCRNYNIHSIIGLAARSYAGGIVEKLIREGSHDSGVRSDLKNATNVIYEAVTEWGIGPNVGYKNVAHNKDLKKMYSKKIQKDVDLITNTSAKVAELIVDFNKDFITDYVDNYRANIGKGGSTLMGEDFIKLHNKWIKDNHKEQEQEILEQKIDILINAASKGKELSEDKLNEKLQKRQEKVTNPQEHI